MMCSDYQTDDRTTSESHSAKRCPTPAGKFRPPNPHLQARALAPTSAPAAAAPVPAPARAAAADRVSVPLFLLLGLHVACT